MLNTFVDAQLFVNVQVSFGKVGFRLVVIVVGDKIFHGIVGKVAHHFLMQLTSKRLVVAHDEGRDVELLNDVRHRKRLAATGHAKQDTPFLAIFQLRN